MKHIGSYGWKNDSASNSYRRVSSDNEGARHRYIYSILHTCTHSLSLHFVLGERDSIIYIYKYIHMYINNLMCIRFILLRYENCC